MIEHNLTPGCPISNQSFIHCYFCTAATLPTLLVLISAMPFHTRASTHIIRLPPTFLHDLPLSYLLFKPHIKLNISYQY